MLSEKQVQAKFLRALDKAEIYYIKTIACSKAGVPDVVICYGGIFFAVEIKALNGRLSKLQQYNFDRIENNGGKIAIISEKNINFAIDLLTQKEVLKKIQNKLAQSKKI